MTKPRRLRRARSVGLILSMLLVLTSAAWAQAADRPVASPLGQPDTAAPAGWSTLRYLFVAGTALRPRDSTDTWDNGGSGGCLFQTAGSTSGIFNIHLDLPSGSRIEYLRLFYYDTSSATSYAWVTSYDGAGGYSDRTSVTSSGTSGYGTRLSPYLGHVVEYHDKSYVLNWRSNQIGNTMQLCGLRVAYRAPLPFDNYLPLVIK